MAEGNVANSNGMVMGKGVMDLSTLLLTRNVVALMPKNHEQVSGGCFANSGIQMKSTVMPNYCLFLL